MYIYLFELGLKLSFTLLHYRLLELFPTWDRKFFPFYVMYGCAIRRLFTVTKILIGLPTLLAVRRQDFRWPGCHRAPPET